MTPLELSIAWRYMRSRRGSRLVSLISLIAVSGVVVGVSALIVIMGVMNGMQTDLRDKILVASPDVRIQPMTQDFMIPDSIWRPTMALIAKQPGVKAVAPFVSTQALISFGQQYREGGFILGVLPRDELGGAEPVTTLTSMAIEGDFTFRTPNGDRSGAVIGDKLAEQFGVTVGDSLQLTSGGSQIDPVTGYPKLVIRQYLVTGIFKTGMYQYDRNFIALSLAAAQDLAQLGSGVTGLELRTATHSDAAGVARAIQPLLHAGDSAVDWHDQDSALFKALDVEKIAMLFILLLIALVAAFNIVGTLTMVVADKTREIGILRAMGVTAKSIRRVFFAQGMLIGGAGTAIGLSIGLAVSFLIDRFKLIPLAESVYYIDHLPVETRWLDVTLIVIASMVIAALATLYPARLASSLYPVEAIRHE